MSGPEIYGSDAGPQTIELTDSFQAGVGAASLLPYHLVLVHSESAGGKAALPIPPEGLVLGRGPFAANETGEKLSDPALSRRHAKLSLEGEVLWLEDLRSRNHSYVDGHLVAPELRVMLEEGSVLRLGSSIFVVRRGALLPEAEPSEISIRLPGQSAATAAVRERIARVANLKTPVLVTGETGTGKEYAAKAIHAASTLRMGPFVAINCGLLSRVLAQAQLFGSERGAFTDAQERSGLIAAAAEGTLFLDEIGELDLDVQKELLRFLEDGTYRRVGGDKTLVSTARVVAATNADLRSGIDAGTFRRDLYARLIAGAQAIVLPPLRKRREDLPLWFASFVNECSGEPLSGKEKSAPKRWTSGVTEILLLHNWPENLRELKMAAREAVQAASDAREITSAHIPSYISEGRVRARDEAPAAEPIVPAPPKEAREVVSREDVTREELVAALLEQKGNVKRVAEALKIDRRELYRLRDRFGLDLGDYRAIREKTSGPDDDE